MRTAVVVVVLAVLAAGSAGGQEKKGESPSPTHPAFVWVTKYNPDGKEKWTRSSWAYFRDDRYGIHVHFYGNIPKGGLDLGGDSLTVGDLVVDSAGVRWKIVPSGKKTKFGSTGPGIPVEKLPDAKK